MINLRNRQLFTRKKKKKTTRKHKIINTCSYDSSSLLMTTSIDSFFFFGLNTLTLRFLYTMAVRWTESRNRSENGKKINSPQKRRARRAQTGTTARRLAELSGRQKFTRQNTSGALPADFHSRFFQLERSRFYSHVPNLNVAFTV